MATNVEVERRNALRFWGLRIAVVLLVLAVPIVWLTFPRPFRGEPLPNPNGYDTLLSAAGAMKTQSPRRKTEPISLDDATTEELRAFVSANEEAIASAKFGLRQASYVPLTGAKTLQSHMNDFGKLRGLGRLIPAQAMLFERENQPIEAADRFLDTIRLGHAFSQGGLIMDRLVENAVQWPGIEGLNRLSATFTTTDAKRLAREVERLEDTREPLDRVVDRDHAFALAQGGWPLRLAYAVNRKALQGFMKPAIASAEQADRRGRAALRLLATTLALRAYRLDHPDAHAPASVYLLIPDYLSAIPIDPLGKGPLKLKRQGGEVIPYSVGVNGLDDGGIPPESKKSTGNDLLLGIP